MGVKSCINIPRAPGRLSDVRDVCLKILFTGYYTSLMNTIASSNFTSPNPGPNRKTQDVAIYVSYGQKAILLRDAWQDIGDNKRSRKRTEVRRSKIGGNRHKEICPDKMDKYAC